MLLEIDLGGVEFQLEIECETLEFHINTNMVETHATRTQIPRPALNPNLPSAANWRPQIFSKNNKPTPSISMFDLRCFSCLFWVFGFCSFAGRFGKFALHLDVFPLIHLIFSKNNKPTPSISMFDLCCCCCFFFFCLVWVIGFRSLARRFGEFDSALFWVGVFAMELKCFTLEYKTWVWDTRFPTATRLQLARFQRAKLSITDLIC